MVKVLPKGIRQEKDIKGIKIGKDVKKTLKMAWFYKWDIPIFSINVFENNKFFLSKRLCDKTDWPKSVFLIYAND